MPQNIDDTALLTAMFDAAVDAIIVSDAIGTINRVNKAACDLFGHSAEEMQGQNLTMLMPGHIAVHHRGYMDHHIQTGEKRIIGIGREVEGIHKAGKPLPLHLSVGKAMVGDQIAFIGILHDLSARKSTEQILARSQRMDAVGKMTGGVAHDFNNMLTVIIGNLELLEMRMNGDSGKDLLQDALSAAELGADLTSRLMVFARKSALNPIRTNINEVVQGTLSMLKRTVGAQCEVQTELGRDLPDIWVDPNQLQTSIVNLAVNSQDAMPNGGRILLETLEVGIDDDYIAQETDVNPGNYVRLSISDSGTGMTQEARSRAFEPFFTTKESGKGTGLGLSIVYGFARQSGGYATLYSEEGKGTTISLYFPTLDPDDDSKQARLKPKTADVLRGKGQLILIAEDDPKVQRLSCERVRDLGYDCLAASSADEAYALLQENPDVALLFTDLVMPGKLSGEQLARKVRASHPHVRILLTSGYSENLTQLSDPATSEFRFLRKPYRLPELATALHNLLSNG